MTTGLKQYTAEELADILHLHEMWQLGEVGGSRADLSQADLRDWKLAGAELKGALLPYGFVLSDVRPYDDGSIAHNILVQLNSVRYSSPLAHCLPEPGDPTGTASDLLLEALSDDDSYVRARAIALLSEGLHVWDKRIVDSLEKAFEDDSRGIRGMVLEAFAKVWYKNRPLVCCHPSIAKRIILRAVEDPSDDDVTWRALMIISSQLPSDPDILDMLTRVALDISGNYDSQHRSLARDTLEEMAGNAPGLYDCSRLDPDRNQWEANYYLAYKEFQRRISDTGMKPRFLRHLQFFWSFAVAGSLGAAAKKMGLEDNGDERHKDVLYHLKRLSSVLGLSHEAEKGLFCKMPDNRMSLGDAGRALRDWLQIATSADSDLRSALSPSN